MEKFEEFWDSKIDKLETECQLSATQLNYVYDLCLEAVSVLSEKPLNKVVEDGQVDIGCKFYHSCGYVIRSCSKDCDMYTPAT